MSITLDDLVTQLQEEVPPKNGVPTQDSYERMVREAVRDFSRRCGLKKRATLNVVSGTATYDLAPDYLKLIKILSLVSAGGVIHSAAGLIPVPSNFCEDHIIGNGQITFYPTPTYTLAREYTYKSAWISTVDDYGEIYLTMGEEEADIVLLKAKSAALDSLWRGNAGKGFKYQIGDEMVDKSGLGDDYEKSRDAAVHGYLDACDSYNGNTGRMM